jgi:hypothetical protein
MIRGEGKMTIWSDRHMTRFEREENRKDAKADLDKRYRTLPTGRRALMVKSHMGMIAPFRHKLRTEHVRDMCRAGADAAERLTSREKRLLLKELRVDLLAYYEYYQRALNGDDPFVVIYGKPDKSRSPKETIPSEELSAPIHEPEEPECVLEGFFDPDTDQCR